MGDFFLSANLIRLFSRNPVTLRHRLAKNTTRIGRRFLKAFNIKISMKHPERLAELADKNYLAVANHVSYTDIIILASLENFVFITSVEMGKNVFLGSITRLGGCLFTDRKKFVSLPDEIEKFANTIKAGFKVMLFPEGTSTNGETVKEFRKSLFKVALLADCPVLPICIRYKALDGKPIDEFNRDLVYWYGDMTFAPHFMKLLGHSLSAEIDFLDPIYELEGKTRQTLSNDVYTQICDCYHQRSSPGSV
ncbi:MAG: 1-acyl-sn-glycerol-3-phosphate acyltransferase [Candidatus Cloacimonetes bacterium HGW-Cloacimonetes-3]|nr:MAG: 1-acyl-sn-glycerol-3-phosphate acyltransferase [Candidatus Cloacimonetes bacterium HGW-Cloacimonetes-3]